MAKPDFSKMSTELDEGSLEEAKVLLANKKSILRQLCEAGMKSDMEMPYTYHIPTGLAFDCGKEMPVRSLYAIIIMARATHTDARWKDCDEEGYPEIFPYNGTEKGFHKIGVFDPFANEIETAIKEYQTDMLKSGRARIVNGLFYKVA